jgi:hypothetical protein
VFIFTQMAFLCEFEIGNNSSFQMCEYKKLKNFKFTQFATCENKHPCGDQERYLLLLLPTTELQMQHDK